MQAPTFGDQHTHASTNPTLIFESQAFESPPIDIVENNTGEINIPAIAKPEHLTSGTEESDHAEEKLDSEIPNVGISDYLQPLTDATATSNPENFLIR